MIMAENTDVPLAPGRSQTTVLAVGAALPITRTSRNATSSSLIGLGSA
jgi:hypothetical protein